MNAKIMPLLSFINANKKLIFLAIYGFIVERYRLWRVKMFYNACNRRDKFVIELHGKALQL